MVPGLALPPSLPAAKMDKKSGFSHAYRSTWGWNGGDGGGERDIDGLQWDLVFVATDTLTCRGRPAAKSAGRCALLVLPATSCPPAPGAPGSRSKCWWRPTSLQKQCGCARQNVGGGSSSSSAVSQHAQRRFVNCLPARCSPLTRVDGGAHAAGVGKVRVGQVAGGGDCVAAAVAQVCRQGMDRRLSVGDAAAVVHAS